MQLGRAHSAPCHETNTRCCFDATLCSLCALPKQSAVGNFRGGEADASRPKFWADRAAYLASIFVPLTTHANALLLIDTAADTRILFLYLSLSSERRGTSNAARPRCFHLVCMPGLIAKRIFQLDLRNLFEENATNPFSCFVAQRERPQSRRGGKTIGGAPTGTAVALWQTPNGALNGLRAPRACGMRVGTSANSPTEREKTLCRAARSELIKVAAAPTVMP